MKTLIKECFRSSVMRFGPGGEGDEASEGLIAGETMERSGYPRSP